MRRASSTSGRASLNQPGPSTVELTGGGQRNTAPRSLGAGLAQRSGLAPVGAVAILDMHVVACSQRLPHVQHGHARGFELQHAVLQGGGVRPPLDRRVASPLRQPDLGVQRRHRGGAPVGVRLRRKLWRRVKRRRFAEDDERPQRLRRIRDVERRDELVKVLRERLARVRTHVGHDHVVLGQHVLAGGAAQRVVDVLHDVLMAHRKLDAAGHPESVAVHAREEAAVNVVV
eukprot:3934312-Prymnesium_polylepis.1